MSWLTALRNFVATTEADVVAIVVKIHTGVDVVISEIEQALHWVASHAPIIAADIQSVVNVAEAVGVGANPEVAIAIAAANASVVALNAFAAASKKGQSDTSAVVAGYVAVKQAQAAAASASAAALAPKKA